MTLRVGITGGMGSGKTTVAAIFATLGIPVYQADDAAKRLMNEDETLKALLKEKFGEETFKEFNTIELFYKYMLIHSIFISAYSAFESQLTAIAQLLEKYVPSQKKIKDFKRRRSKFD